MAKVERWELTDKDKDLDRCREWNNTKDSFISRQLLDVAQQTSK